MLFYTNRGQLISFNLKNGYYIYASALYNKESNIYKCDYFLSDSEDCKNTMMIGIWSDVIQSERNDLFKNLSLHIEEVWGANEEEFQTFIDQYKYILMCIRKGDEYFKAEFEKNNANTNNDVDTNDDANTDGE